MKGRHLLYVLTMLQGVISSHGYLPIERDVRSSVHGKILRDGILYLSHLLQAAPGLNDSLTLVLNQEEALYRGLRMADFEAGTLSILGGRWSRNELSHFYNPTTQQGYQAGLRVSWIRQLERHGWLSKDVSLLLGPTISAADMVNWYYSRAIQVAQSNMTEALESLGYAAHIVMDATVPQHATDCGDENAACGHRRYEEHIESHYDMWELAVFDGQTNEYLSTREVQQLASGTAGEIVRYGALQSQPLLDLVARGASESTMEEAAQYLIPLAQQLVASIMLLFVADLRNSFNYQEAVVLQIKSIELDGEWNERSQADFQPFVTSDSTRMETRGYIAGSNFVYSAKSINSHAWTFVHTMDRSHFLVLEKPLVSFQVEIHDVVADKCGRRCGEPQRELLLGSGGRTVIQISLPIDDLSREDVVEGSSTGCDLQQMEIDNCKNAVKVTWKVGRSYLMKGNTEHIDVFTLSYNQFVTSSGLCTIVFSFLTLLIVSVCLMWGGACFVRKLRSKRRPNSPSIDGGDKSEVENPYPDSELNETAFSDDDNSEQQRLPTATWPSTGNVDTDEVLEEARDTFSPIPWPLPKFHDNIDDTNRLSVPVVTSFGRTVQRVSIASSSETSEARGRTPTPSSDMEERLQDRSSSRCSSVLPDTSSNRPPSRSSSSTSHRYYGRADASATSSRCSGMPDTSCHTSAARYSDHGSQPRMGYSSVPLHKTQTASSTAEIVAQVSDRINQRRAKPVVEVGPGLQRWEMLDDSTLPDEASHTINHPLNLDADLSGQQIIVGRHDGIKGFRPSSIPEERIVASNVY